MCGPAGIICKTNVPTLFFCLFVYLVVIYLTAICSLWHSNAVNADVFTQNVYRLGYKTKQIFIQDVSVTGGKTPAVILKPFFVSLITLQMNEKQLWVPTRYLSCCKLVPQNSSFLSFSFFFYLCSVFLIYLFACFKCKRLCISFSFL